MKELIFELRKHYELQRMNSRLAPVLRDGIAANAYTQSNETLYEQLNAFLGQNPHIQKTLERVHQFFPQSITMAVLDNMNQKGACNQGFVLARVRQDGLYCLFPKIMCTNNAINDLFPFNVIIGSKDTSSYRLAVSDDSLREELFQHAAMNPNSEHWFSYDTSRMDPRDYVALGVQGLLMGGMQTASPFAEDRLFLLPTLSE